MSKTKGLGKFVNKSVESMTELQGSLKGFLDMPLKKGLHSAGVGDDDLNKSIHEAMTKAFELNHLVADLNDAVKGLKYEDKSSRFAAQKVIETFLKA